MVNVMNVEYLSKVPEWYKSNEKFDLVLSDDIDSLTTVAVVQSVHPNWNVEYFYDFDIISMQVQMLISRKINHAQEYGVM